MSDTTPTLFSLGRLPAAVGLAKGLASELGWMPSYWITQPELDEIVAGTFPTAVRHDFAEANRGSKAIDTKQFPSCDVKQVLQDGLLTRMALQIVSRHVLANALSVEQQMAFLTERLEYCLNVVRGLQLKVFVLNSTPHSVIDFCFYVVFKQLGLPVRMLHLTGHNGVQVILDDAIGDPLGLSAVVSGQTNLSVEGAAILAKLTDKSQELTPWYVRNQNETDKKLERYYAMADRILDEGWHSPGEVDFDNPLMIPKEVKIEGLFRSRTVSQQTDAFERKFQPHQEQPMRRGFAFRAGGFGADPITWKQYYTYRDWMLLVKRQGKRDYERLTQSFDPDSARDTNFIYFPLHYQPERTTCPEGGVYSDQILAIRTMASALPDGWRLWVKEHPSQFLWQTEGELGRWPGYYEALQDIEGVDLVPLDISSDQLIETCRAVATITGTVGWEARARCKPVIVMARPWYALCPGIELAKTPTEIAEAVKRIADGFSPDSSDLRPFLAGLERIGRRCFLNPSHGPLYEELSEEQNIENLVDLFASSERKRP